jgi:dihydrofolate reductase
MRKLVSGLFMSLDGVVESPSSWAGPYFTDEMFAWIETGLPDADAILLGRCTYLEFAQQWPSQGTSTPMATFLNQTPKHVVTSSSDPLGWGPASAVRGDLGDEIAALKRQPGKNIQVPGSPRLVRWLLAHHLLDELSLGILPVAVGSGMRLFADITEQIPLTVAEAKTFSSGVLAVTYRAAT